MIELVIEERRRSIGPFEVGRVLPFAKRRMVGPFIFLDHMGPMELPKGVSRDTDVRPHPHIGLATVTYLFAGEITHRDSTGVEQAIRPGEINWMIAGQGITHSERFERARREVRPLHAIRSWTALPKTDEEAEPAFVHYESADMSVHRDGEVWRACPPATLSACVQRSGRTRHSSTRTLHSNPTRASPSLPILHYKDHEVHRTRAG